MVAKCLTLRNHKRTLDPTSSNLNLACIKNTHAGHASTCTMEFASSWKCKCLIFRLCNLLNDLWWPQKLEYRVLALSQIFIKVEWSHEIGFKKRKSAVNKLRVWSWSCQTELEQDRCLLHQAISNLFDTDSIPDFFCRKF